MNRKLIIDGNAVYEIDEDCMLKKRLDKIKKTDGKKRQDRKEPLNQQIQNQVGL